MEKLRQDKEKKRNILFWLHNITIKHRELICMSLRLGLAKVNIFGLCYVVAYVQILNSVINLQLGFKLNNIFSTFPIDTRLCLVSSIVCDEHIVWVTQVVLICL